MSWTEAEVVDVELRIHTLLSIVTKLGAIVTCAIKGALLLISDEATKE
jgi:hypothetical protein